MVKEIPRPELQQNQKSTSPDGTGCKALEVIFFKELKNMSEFVDKRFTPLGRIWELISNIDIEILKKKIELFSSGKMKHCTEKEKTQL